MDFASFKVTKQFHYGEVAKSVLRGEYALEASKNDFFFYKS